MKKWWSAAAVLVSLLLMSLGLTVVQLSPRF